ncbi:HTH domain-containing protein, partial [Lancefieldella rimae]|uniref:HTH domain-containing protein n=1 Tax=Lancefieldella rimae TaxID=1383 RepID=UPI003C6FEC9B
VPRNVPRMSSEELKSKIFEMIKKDSKVSRKFMAEELKVNEKTISRYIKEIPYIKYVGKGKNGYWEVYK